MLIRATRDDGVVETGSAARRHGLSPLRVSVQLALAAAVITALSCYARTNVEPSGAARLATSFVPLKPADQGPPLATVAQFGLAEPGSDPVRVASGRVDARTGQREDTLTRGDFDTMEAPMVRVTLTRGRSADLPSSLFVLMARRAAAGPEIGHSALSVLRTGPYSRIDTKFGAVELLEVTLGGASQRTCIGFVTREATSRLDGWLCAPLAQPPEAQTVACMIDALSLVDLADPDTTAAFSAAPRNSEACAFAKPTAEAASRTGSIGRRARIKK